MSKLSLFLNKSQSKSKIQLLYDYGYDYLSNNFNVKELCEIYDFGIKNNKSLSEFVVDTFFLSSENNQVLKDFYKIPKNRNLYDACQERYIEKMKHIEKKEIEANPYNFKVATQIMEINALEEKLAIAKKELLIIPIDKLTCEETKQLYNEYIQKEMINE